MSELEQLRLTCESLALRFESEPLARVEKSDLLHRWEDLLKESHMLQAMLDLLEREETEAALSGANGTSLPDARRFTCFYHAKDRMPMA
jgi:hypothetical protein